MHSRGSPWLGIVTILTLSPTSAIAGPPRLTQVEPLFLPDETVPRAPEPPPMRLAESLSLTAPLALPKASSGAGDQLAALAAWNAAGRRPAQNGFARRLAHPVDVRLDASAKAAARFRPFASGYLAESLRGGLVWGTQAHVSEAFRLRLRLEDVTLPEGSRLWVWGLGEEPQPFGLELRSPEGDLWTPSVGGEDIFLEVELPAESLAAGATWGFAIREVAEIFRLDAQGAPMAGSSKTHCLVDGSCVTTATLDAIGSYRKAVAHLEFIQGGFSFICTGALLSDLDDSTVIPYLLTAAHCFSTPPAASTLEAFWDYRTPSCGGVAPALSSLPRSNGATLLATGEASDFTLVQLFAIPAGRTLLAWAISPIAPGVELHRLSHPAPEGVLRPQSYSRSTASGSVSACTGKPRPQFIYSLLGQGGTFGGSDGAPVIRPGGYVVGHLSGTCPTNPADGCDAATAQVDGAFSTTYAAISQFLSPDPAGPCAPNATTLCIDEQPGDKRFRVQVTFETASSSGQGHAIPTSSLGVTSGGLFWFFGPSNPEMLIKVLNGCGVNNRFWVFYSAGTNVGLTTTVTDTVSGASKTYTNLLNTPAPPVQDTSAFACP